MKLLWTVDTTEIYWYGGIKMSTALWKEKYLRELALHHHTDNYTYEKLRVVDFFYGYVDKSYDGYQTDETHCEMIFQDIAQNVFYAVDLVIIDDERYGYYEFETEPDTDIKGDKLVSCRMVKPIIKQSIKWVNFEESDQYTVGIFDVPMPIMRPKLIPIEFTPKPYEFDFSIGVQKLSDKINNDIFDQITNESK